MADDADDFEAALAATTARRGDTRSKRARRRFDEEFAPAPPDIDRSVPAEWWPSIKQYAEWWDSILPEMLTDPDGWWYGWCPLHDKAHDAGQPTAMFHFKFGCARCLADPRCHESGTMTLQNMMVAVLRAGDGN